MKAKFRQSGLTLMEQVVVIAVIAMLIVFGLPAVRALFRSLESHSGARAMISASLASARAIAAKEQHYAGIRFQHAYYKDDPDNAPLKAPQYMIFIVHDFDKTKLANGFRAVEGIEPIKLPDNVGVMEVVNDDDEIDDKPSGELTDKTTFSIIFSPSGKLVMHPVHTRNRDGESSGTGSKDGIFNTETNVEDNGIGMFVQDGDDESSKNSFRIYDRDIFEKVDEGNRWSDYLKDLEVIYINPYTGTMINR